MVGVRGWVRIESYTRPIENILEHPVWMIAGRDRVLEEGRRQGRGLAAKLRGVDDRDAAAALIGEEIRVARAALPPPPEGQYYWADLIGLEVVCASGERLGTVERVFDNGAQDVLVVRGEREHWIPFVPGARVKSVDLNAGKIVVDWAPDY